MKSDRVFYFDHLRVWATVGVVVLHSSSSIVLANRGKDIDLVSQFNVANAYDSLGRFAVDCFFMISGALLLAPEHTFRLRKQFLRVFWPLLSWSLIYVVANLYFDHRGLPAIGGSNTDDSSLLSAAKAFLTGPLSGHLWFVYALLGIYLIVPLLRPLTSLSEPLRTQLLHYAFALWLVFSIAVPTLHAVAPGIPNLYAPAVPDIPTLYVGMFLLGFHLHHRDLNIPQPLLVLGVIGSIGTIALVAYLEQVLRAGSLWVYEYYAPPVVLCAASIFLLAKSVHRRPGRLYPWVKLGSRLSYRIYLMHILILHCISSISPFKDWYFDAPALSIPILAASTLVLSFAASWLLDQIRPISRYV